jgi:photosystem II stability/assembly factor-like uncharacterized protein
MLSHVLRYTALALAVWLSSPAMVRAQVSDSAILASLKWRNIGPANPTGRIVDIEAVEGDFRTVYVAAASGGVWKSVNAGTTWTPIFDHYGTAWIGDIALFQADPRIVWVGTGEANNRNSVGWGDGLYKSTDGGATFRNVGLSTTHHIARVVTHPTDSQRVYACATGHLWGYSGDRGLFETTDGGASWRKLGGGLPDDGRTGCTDLVMDPSQPGTLYAAFYHRLRKPWTFHSGGPNGGIFKSVDGGRSWRELTAGLPAGETGRIGLDVYRRNPRILMAIVEAERGTDLSVPGSGLYRSEDGGESWQYVNTYNNRPFYYSQIRINPVDSSRVYVLTTRFMVSQDGGRTLADGSEDQEVHGDYHALWLDPSNADRYYLGADKGASLTHDHGARFQLFDNLPIAQYYRIGVDMRDPYFVYGGLQDNGTFGGPSLSRDARGILNDESWKLHWGDGQDVQVDPTDWRTLYTEAENGSFRRYDVLTRRYSGAPPGPDNTLNWASVLGAGSDPDSVLRFNWSAPLVMSPHDTRTLYLGGNHVFRTADRGETWTILSPDLSTRDPEKTAAGRSGGLTPDNTGAETHGTVTSVAESPVAPGVLWAVTDDGNVQLSRDAGGTWTNVRPRIRGVPAGIWAGRVEASPHDPGTAFVTFDGHRSDVFRPWIFRTTDYGQSWSDIGAALPPDEVVHVLRADPRNPALLFAATETGVFGTLDGGASWHRAGGNLPVVPVQDLVLHPRDHDLVAGTHGRGIWILDDVSPLQRLTRGVRAKSAHLFENPPATIWENLSRGAQRGHFWWAGENPPEIVPTGSLPRANFRSDAAITYWLRSNGSAPTLKIRDPVSGRVRSVRLSSDAGIRRYYWDRAWDPAPMSAGQRARLAEQLDSLLANAAQAARSGIQRVKDRFASASTDTERYAALRALPRSARSSLGLEDAAVAGPGTYHLALVVGGQTVHGTLTVRADPLLDEPR